MSPDVEAMIFASNGFFQCGGADCHYSGEISVADIAFAHHRALVIGDHRLIVHAPVQAPEIGGEFQPAPGAPRQRPGRIGAGRTRIRRGVAPGPAPAHRRGGTRAVLSASQGFAPDYATRRFPQNWRCRLTLEWRDLHGITGPVGKERRNPHGLCVQCGPARSSAYWNDIEHWIPQARMQRIKRRARAGPPGLASR